MEYKCPCGNIYSHKQSLYYHRKNCIVYAKQSNPPQPVEAQVVEAIKSNVEHEEQLEVQHQYYKQLLEEQEKNFKQLLQEKDNYYQQLIEEKDNRYEQLLQEKDNHYKQLLQEKDNHYKQLLEEKDKRIAEQKQTIEFMKTITMQRPSIMQIPIEQAPILEAKAPEAKQPKKHFCLKEYLNTRNPITIDEFYDNYKPTIEEYDNIFSIGFTNAIIINFANYAKSYGERCPIVVTNVQYERLHVYAYKKVKSEDDQPIGEPKVPLEEVKWVEYDRIDAQLYMKDDIVIRFVNKYQKHISVFNDKYKNCLEKPSDCADENVDMSKKLTLIRAINTAEQVSDKISREIAYKLAINRD